MTDPNPPLLFDDLCEEPPEDLSIVRHQLSDSLAENPEVVAPALVSLIEEARPSVGTIALHTLHDCADNSPEKLESAIPAIIDLLSTVDYRSRADLTLLLVKCTRESPLELADSVDQLRSYLAVSSHTIDESILETRGRESTFVNSLRDQYNREDAYRTATARNVAQILALVAYEKPTVLEPHVEFFCSNLSDRDEQRTCFLLESIAVVSESNPHATQTVVDELADRLEHGKSERVRGLAAWALTPVVESRTSFTVYDRIDFVQNNLHDMLESDDPQTLGGYLGFLAAISEIQPDRLGEVKPALRRLQRHDREYIRTTATRILQNLS